RRRAARSMDAGARAGCAPRRRRNSAARPSDFCDRRGGSVRALAARAARRRLPRRHQGRARLRAACGGAPPVLAWAMLRRPTWLGVVAPVLGLAALPFELHLAIFGEFGVRLAGLHLFGTRELYLQLGTAVILLSAAAFTALAARTGVPTVSTFRPSRYTRSAGLLLAFLGIVQLVLPDF